MGAAPDPERGVDGASGRGRDGGWGCHGAHQRRRFTGGRDAFEVQAPQDRAGGDAVLSRDIYGKAEGRPCVVPRARLLVGSRARGLHGGWPRACRRDVLARGGRDRGEGGDEAERGGGGHASGEERRRDQDVVEHVRVRTVCVVIPCIRCCGWWMGYKFLPLTYLSPLSSHSPSPSHTQGTCSSASSAVPSLPRRRA